MNKELEEAIKYFRKRMDICLENAEICDENDFDEEATCLRKEQILIEIILNYIEILETATNNKYPYVIGGRTLYSRLQQLTKEDLIKAYLRLRNETEQLIKEKENSIPKEKVEEKKEELGKEFYRLDEETDKYLKEDNKDLTKYYEQRERTAVMQTIGWAIGKIEELLEGK